MWLVILKYEISNIKIRENVHILNNDYIDIDNYRFICSTLWTQIKPVDSYYVVKSMDDFRKIKQEDGKMLSV